MWFYITNGHLNDCFRDFYSKVIKSKMIYLSFKNLNIMEQKEVVRFINNSYLNKNENIKGFINSLYFIGNEGINIYLYETLYSKLYSEYEFFIKELVAYINNYNENKYKKISCKKKECKFKNNKKNQCINCNYVRISDNSFEFYKEYMEKKINNREIRSILNKIDAHRIVRNYITHNNSIIDKSAGYTKRINIESVVSICHELEPLEFIEINDIELEELYDNIESLLYKLRDYFIANQKEFRIKEK